MRTYRKIPTLSNRELKRFWSFVAKAGRNDCWEWQGHINPQTGYPVFVINRVHLYSHRISASLAGIDISESHACHKCDNPPCVNPRHLFPGNDSANMKDAERKGRIGVYTQRGNYSKIPSPEVVRAIREDKVGSQKAIALRHGVHQSTVSRIHKGISWARGL